MKKTHILIRTLLLISIAILIIGCAVNSASQITSVSDGDLIVNINAKTSTTENPVFIELNAGTYNVSVIGISGGGVYDAWKPWILKPKKNREGIWKRGWMTKYSFRCSEFPEVTYAEGMYYETPANALAKAINSKFSLEKKGNVYFYIQDSPYYDNAGGVSLLISPTSEKENIK